MKPFKEFTLNYEELKKNYGLLLMIEGNNLEDKCNNLQK